MENRVTTPPVFWTNFSTELRTELRNHLDPNKLGAAIENPNDAASRSEISTIANKFLHQKQYKLAEELYTYYYQARTAELGGRTDADTLSTKYSIGYAQLEQGELAESENTWKEILSLELYGLDNKLRMVLGAKNNLGVALNRQGKFQEAETVLRDLLPEIQKEFPESDPRVLGCMRHLMEALVGQGKVEEAKMMCERGMVLAETVSEVHRKDEIEAMEEMQMKIDGSK
ncbi:hypothetical protein EG329_001459 [Mollisiaceae sp. DMI_Dod_QoI]|nr:hypothetical protein EG329_001459 [Helotiales sp. DMI_Dod_QoI]